MKRLIICLVLLLPCTTTQAFEVKTVQGMSSTVFLKWDISKGAIPVTLNSAGSVDLPFSETEKALIGAMDAWQNVSSQNVRFQYRGASASAGVNNTDGMNSVVWVEKGWKYSHNVLAYTAYSYYVQDPPYIFDADIQVNGEDFQWASGSKENADTADAQQVLTHELGHLLGIAHTSAYKASLYPYLPSKVKHKVSKDDKAAIRFLYGTPSNNFVLISPVNNTGYVKGMADRGLPLPVFRWNTGTETNFTLEFSGSSSFSEKIVVQVGSNNYFPVSGSQEKDLEKLASEDGDKLYWRVATPGTTTSICKVKFKEID